MERWHVILSSNASNLSVARNEVNGLGLRAQESEKRKMKSRSKKRIKRTIKSKIRTGRPRSSLTLDFHLRTSDRKTKTQIAQIDAEKNLRESA